MNSLAEFSKNLRNLPKVVGIKVAEEAAPAITALAKETFEAGENPYGNLWAPGADGQRVTLHKTGALEDKIKYVAIGTKLRVALGVPYAKYQIGKRPVFPRQDGDLPTEYVQTLQRVAVDIVKRELQK